MDKIINKIFIGWRQIYIRIGPFTKHSEAIQKFRETGYLKHWYRNELGRLCLAHDVASSDSKDLVTRTTENKILKDRADEIITNRGYDGYQRVLASMVDTFFDKKTGAGLIVNEH